MSRKTFYTIIFCIIALLLVAGWYFLFRANNPTPTVQSSQNQNIGILPFGQPGDTGQGTGKLKTPTSTVTIIDLTASDTPATPRLRQISSVPTAGAVIFDIGSTTMIRYIERATGHIYETISDRLGIDQISTITIPKIHEALWSGNGKSLIIRYLKSDDVTISTFAATLSTSTDPDKALRGSFLADNINSVSISTTSIFYLDESIDGAQGVRANFDGSAKTDIFDSSFGDWASVWSSKDIVIYPRPSGSMNGAAYFLNPKTGTLASIVGDVAGLEALSNPDESEVMYSGGGQRIGAAIYDVRKAMSQDLGVATLADKCVWSLKNKNMMYCAVPKTIADGAYPDDWYKGKVAFDDSLWSIDVSSGQTTQIFVPEELAKTPMDMINLSLDQSETALLFTNKNDMTVWRYDLK